MAKRARTQEDCMQAVMKEATVEAMDEEFPWSGALAEPMREYIKTLANAANAPPEFILLGLLVSASAAMGPSTSVGPLPDYQEPVNLFVVCIAPAGSRKT